MKKTTFLLLAVFTIANLHSQVYEIDFAGTGEATVVDSVKIENLNQGTTLILNGTDVLELTIPTALQYGVEEPNLLRLYPNPMSEQAEIQFPVNSFGAINVAVFDITGHLVVESTELLQTGIHTYRVSGLKQGIYLVLVRGEDAYFSDKLVSRCASSMYVKIEHINQQNINLNTTRAIQLKSTVSAVEFPYLAGERLLFTGMSGNFSTVKTLVPSENTTITFEFMDCTDADTNHYPVVKIGTQIWMAENLKTTHYMNGDSIPTTYPADLNIVDSIAPKYQWAFNGDENNANTYGRMYTWHVLDDLRGVCPVGWHVADSSEIMEMALYIFNLGNYLSKDMASTKYWNNSDIANSVGNHPELNNRCGIGIVPNGSRHEDGSFLWLGDGGGFWSLTAKDESSAYDFGIMNYDSDIIGIFAPNKNMGDAIRCIKDAEK
jgi:uncharacterized protein (TIGR02145 family)